MASGTGRSPPLMSPAEHQAGLALGSSFTSLRGPPHARGLRDGLSNDWLAIQLRDSPDDSTRACGDDR